MPDSWRLSNLLQRDITETMSPGYISEQKLNTQSLELKTLISGVLALYYTMHSTETSL
jgi:hypothetical protein